ncbi:MAG: hypothetical protein JSV91_07255 [Phycisphaerales bacterium]|nr:MAG: hypothetical protein JSV91_07255 [Phycisphaerales bacterium]
MTARGVEKLEGIQQDLACPACEYNLRGLRGEVVVCPECGMRIDAARLISRKWTGPWHSAPHYTSLCLPTVIAMAYAVSIVVGSAWLGSEFPDLLQVPEWLLGTVLTLMMWGSLLTWMVHRFGDRKGLWLSLLAHVILFCYLVGALGGVLFLLLEADALLSGQWVQILRYCLGLCFFAALVLAGQLGERYIARQCIRRHLQRQASV